MSTWPYMVENSMQYFLLLMIYVKTYEISTPTDPPLSGTSLMRKTLKRAWRDRGPVSGWGSTCSVTLFGMTRLQPLDPDFLKAETTLISKKTKNSFTPVMLKRSTTSRGTFGTEVAKLNSSPPLMGDRKSIWTPGPVAAKNFHLKPTLILMGVPQMSVLKLSEICQPYPQHVEKLQSEMCQDCVCCFYLRLSRRRSKNCRFSSPSS